MKSYAFLFTVLFSAASLQAATTNELPADFNSLQEDCTFPPLSTTRPDDLIVGDDEAFDSILVALSPFREDARPFEPRDLVVYDEKQKKCLCFR